ncbi:MAG TPA: hypothetical protein VNM48_21655 [Chloroflexota bacterium]|nr:hypothetical protein [Chloroflexota bacterium]
MPMAKAAPDRFVRLRAGLLEPQHVAAMGGGSPFVLYTWLHLRVKFSGEGAGTTFPDTPYRHDDAALLLGAPRSSVRRWFALLVDAGYVTAVRGAHGLAVTITKYTQSECSPMDTQEAERVSTSGQLSVHQRPKECP